MQKLLLHCGAKEVSYEDVCAVETPAMTATHVPIPHDFILNQTVEALLANNCHTEDWQYALNHQGAQMFAMARVVGSERTDHDQVIAVRNAHDKVYKASLVGGSRVFCCDNLAFSGEIQVGRKHTPGILEQLPDLIHEAASHVAGVSDLMEARVDKYKDVGVDQGAGEQYIVEMARRRILPDFNALLRCISAWDEPEHEEFQDWTAWRLFNAATQALKETGFPNPGRTMRLHRMVDQACGFGHDEDTIIVVN